MPTIKGLRARARALLRRGAAERELDEELRFHIEMETEKNVRAGMNPVDARRRALRDFGGVEPTKEAHRDVRGRWLEELGADTRYALRTLRRAPVLATAAILTLALGVGANTTIFSAVTAPLRISNAFSKLSRPFPTIFALGKHLNLPWTSASVIKSFQTGKLESVIPRTNFASMNSGNFPGGLVLATNPPPNFSIIGVTISKLSGMPMAL